MALKLRPDLIEGVERSLCFRFNIWLWQLVAQMDIKVVCMSLETGKRYRFLAKKEIEALQAYTASACNTHSSKEIRLIRFYHSFSSVSPYTRMSPLDLRPQYCRRSVV
jgi:hypothetical protein